MTEKVLTRVRVPRGVPILSARSSRHISRLHEPSSTSRVLGVSLIVALACMVACDSPRAKSAQSVTGPAPLHPNIEPPPDDGGPASYSYLSTITSSGGLPGWSRSDASYKKVIRVTEDWQAQGYWRQTHDYDSATVLFSGYQEAPRVDNGESVKDGSAVTDVSRTGASLDETTRPPIDRLAQGGATYFRGIARSSIPNTSGAGRPIASAPVFSALERRQSRIDKHFPTPAGGARELALLIRQYGPGIRNSQGQQEFRKSFGNQESRLQFDPRLGAITSMESYVDGTLQVRTRRTYGTTNGLLSLEKTSTEWFDAAGRVTAHAEQTISNITIR